MDMPDVTLFREWVSSVNISKMVQLAQNGGPGLPLTIKGTQSRFCAYARF